MFRQITIRNIRSIIETEFLLKKMNVFVGANSSGKSSILAALLALQSLSMGRTYLSRPFKDFNSIRRRGSTRAMSVKLVQLESEGRQTKLETYFTETPSLWYNLKTMLSSGKTEFEELTVSGISRAIDSEILDTASFEDLPAPHRERMKIPLRQPSQGYSYLINEENKDITHSTGHLGLLNFSFVPISREFTQAEKNFLEKRSSYLEHLSKMVYVSVQRGFFDSDYELQDQLRRTLSSDTVSAEEIFNIQAYRDFRDSAATEKMAQWAKIFGIDSFETEIQPGRRIEGRGYIETAEGKEHLPVSLFGFGSNQFLTVIAKCVFAPNGVPILIEEPEIHLHPRMQGLATDFLIEQMEEGHQLFITTHSEHLIGRVQRRLAEKKITPDDVGIFWVQFSPERGTTVEEVEIGEDGILHESLKTYMDFIQEEISATRSVRNRIAHGKEGQ